MKMKTVFSVAFLVLLFSISLLIFSGKEKAIAKSATDFQEFDNCTSVLVTKTASADGSVMTTHSCDGGYDFRLNIIPGKTYKAGEMRPILKGGGNGEERRQAEQVGEIPQVKQTNFRFDIAYPFLNEKQLGIGETTFGGRRELYNPEGKWDIMALQRIVLERTSTAREAIKLMGELVAKDGYGDSGECLTFIDKSEAWVFEIMGAGPLQIGAVWAARRIPEGEVFVSANRSRIGEINPKDTDNYLASENVFSLAEEMGWYDPKLKKPFKFNEAYAPNSSIGSRRREWRVLSTLAPDLNFDPWSVDYPFSVKPKKKVTVEDLKSFHRDFYQGTEFDQSKGLAAAPFNNPNRFSTMTRPPQGYLGWERTISIMRCSYCIIVQARDWLPDWIGGLVWFAEDDPKTSCYIPLYCGITRVPEAIQAGRRDVFSRKSAWWAFDFVSNWANIRWNSIIEDIRKAYGDFENTFRELQLAVEARAKTLYEENPEACREYLTRYSNEMAQRVVDEWWALADYLIVKYNDGSVNVPGERIRVDYPKEWLDAVGYGKTKLKNN